MLKASVNKSLFDVNNKDKNCVLFEEYESFKLILFSEIYNEGSNKSTFNSSSISDNFFSNIFFSLFSESEIEFFVDAWKIGILILLVLFRENIWRLKEENKNTIRTWMAASSCCLVESKSDRMELISVRSLEFSVCDSSHSWKQKQF